MQFCGIKCIHNIVRPSPPSISKCFKQKAWCLGNSSPTLREGNLGISFKITYAQTFGQAIPYLRVYSTDKCICVQMIRCLRCGNVYKVYIVHRGRRLKISEYWSVKNFKQELLYIQCNRILETVKKENKEALYLQF